MGTLQNFIDAAERKHNRLGKFSQAAGRKGGTIDKFDKAASGRHRRRRRK